MRALDQLGIPHRSTLAPGHGEVCVFPTISMRNSAYKALDKGGWTVRDAGPRGILVTAPPLTFRHCHPVVRVLVWLVLGTLACAFWFVTLTLIAVAFFTAANDHPWLAYFYLRRHRGRTPARRTSRHGKTRRF